MAGDADLNAAPEEAHERLASLEAVIGYCFQDRALLHGATIHRSFANEAEDDIADNEVLEFLGDAVLGLVVSELLYRRNPQLSEGEMSKLKAFLVSSDSLARRAEEIGLGHYLVLGKGEEKTDGRLKDSLLANSFEAVIAAVYLDGGLDAASQFIDDSVYRHLADAGDEDARLNDYKSLLQERLQSDGRSLPVYEVVDETGPDHEKVFRVVVEVNGARVGEGEGRTKKAAEQMAADRTLELLGLA